MVYSEGIKQASKGERKKGRYYVIQTRIGVEINYVEKVKRIAGKDGEMAFSEGIKEARKGERKEGKICNRHEVRCKHNQR